MSATWAYTYKLGMRRDIQRIFTETPMKKQVMMFSATLTTETRSMCMELLRLGRQ